MPAKYKLVLRKDMRKGAEADAKLYYANAKAAGTVGIQELCDLIAEGSTASAGGCEADSGRVDTGHAAQSRQRGSGAGRRIGKFPVAVRQYRHADREGVQQCPDQKQTYPVPSGQAVAGCDQQLHLRKDRSRNSVHSFGRGRGRETGRALIS